MVSSVSFIAMFTTLLISFLLPVVLFILIRRSSKYVTGAVIAGAIAFYLCQLQIRIPLLQTVLPKFEWYRAITQNTLVYILFLSVTAALFEETARYLVFQLLLKERQVWKCGIAYGIGHGGIEAIMLVGLTYVNNIVLAVMINNGSFHTYLAGKVNETTAGQIYKSLVEAPPDLFLAAGVERALTIGLHIALSVLVLEGIVRKRRLSFYALAVAVHTAVNFSAAWFAYAKVPHWLIELFLALVAAAGLLYVFRAKKRFGDRIEAEDEATKALKEGY